MNTVKKSSEFSYMPTTFWSERKCRHIWNERKIRTKSQSNFMQ